MEANAGSEPLMELDIGSVTGNEQRFFARDILIRRVRKNILFTHVEQPRPCGLLP